MTSWSGDELRLATTAGAVKVMATYVESGFFRFLRTAPVRAVDAQVPVAEVSTGGGLLRESLVPARFDALVLGGFALLSLLLAAIGLFGALAYDVQQRTREIGIRVALGAGLAEVRRLVVRQALRPVALGLGVGLTGSLAAARLLRGLLFGVGPGDPLTLALVALAIGTTAALASYLPVRRATRVDPVEALRSE